MSRNLLNEELRRIKTMMGLQEQSNPAFKKYSNLTFKLDALPAGLANYNPSMGYIRIDGGNEWLASNRAVSLKNYLLSQFKGMASDANIQVKETKVLGPGNENQYVLGTFFGTMKKKPQRQEKYPYSILYNFYEINGVPHILVTQGGKGSPQKLNATGDKAKQSWAKEFEKFKSKIPSEYSPMIISQTVGGGSAQGPDETETLYGIMLPITKEKFGYTAKVNGQLYFDASAKTQFDTVAKFIADYTDNDFRTDESFKNPNATQHNFTSSRGGAGNYGFGDLGSGRKGRVISLKNPKGTEILIKRMDPSKEGNAPGEEIKTKEGGWVDLGTYKLDDTFFKDNMISIKPETYQKLLTDINNLIIQKTTDGYELDQLGANINAYASSDNATNRLPEGTTSPDHTYGNRVPVDKWVQRD